MKKLLLASSLLALALTAQPTLAKPATLTSTQAASAIGHTATVCGVAASIHFAAHSRGQPTFINLGAPYPHQTFTAVIWGHDLAQFKASPESWQGKKLCVTGKVKSYRGKPEMIVHSPAQVSVS